MSKKEKETTVSAEETEKQTAEGAAINEEAETSCPQKENPLQAELAQANDKFLRLYADFENFKKEAAPKKKPHTLMQKAIRFLHCCRRWTIWSGRLPLPGKRIRR